VKPKIVYPKADIHPNLLVEMLSPENLGPRGAKNLRCGCIEADGEWIMCLYHAGVEHGTRLVGH